MKRRIFALVLLTVVFLLAQTPVLAQQAPQSTTSANVSLCKEKEAGIKARMTRLIGIVQAIETKFDSIESGVENYYTNIIKPSGKTGANIDLLVPAMLTQKLALKTAVTNAQKTANSFSCTNPSPKGDLTQFKTDMLTVKQRITEYRTAIKNYIVAIRIKPENNSSNSAEKK